MKASRCPRWLIASVLLLLLVGCGQTESTKTVDPPLDGDSEQTPSDGDIQADSEAREIEQDKTDRPQEADSEAVEVERDQPENDLSENAEQESENAERVDLDACLNQTRDEAECKDCCDCSGAACEQVVACRDACPIHDFSGNTNFISVNIPSVLGPTGDYGACTVLTTPQACKACCDCDHHFQCGDQQYCRNACATVSPYPPLTFSEIGLPTRLVQTETLQFAEGPVWDSTSGTLIFSDITADTIYRLALPGTLTVFRKPSGLANGLAFDHSGLLLAAEHGSRSVTRRATDGAIATLASAWDGKRLNSPNDLVVRSDGTIYFTDPTYGLGNTPSELGYTGLYRIDKAGKLTLEDKIEGQPNGLAFALGEKTLYVAATTANQLLSFSVTEEGALRSKAVFATVEAPDGLAVDKGGNLYVAGLSQGQGALLVLSPKGQALGSIALPEHPTNCAFGGADGKTLFVTARSALYSLSVPIPGQ